MIFILKGICCVIKPTAMKNIRPFPAQIHTVMLYQLICEQQSITDCNGILGEYQN